jgi:cyanophycin synthetase
MQDVLFDPEINMAVIECTDEEILDSGLGFEACDVAVINDLQASQPRGEIQSPEDFLKLKSVIARTTKAEGCCVLNADDEKVLALQKGLTCKIALFSSKENNADILEHRKKGGVAAVIENSALVVYKGDWKIRICSLNALGSNRLAIKDITPVLLSVVLAAVILNIKVQTIKDGLIHYFIKDYADLKIPLDRQSIG